jgi:hypothetical protein
MPLLGHLEYWVLSTYKRPEASFANRRWSSSPSPWVSIDLFNEAKRNN